MRSEETFVEQPIRSLQTMLRVLSEDTEHYPKVIPDGIYGPKTMLAVTTFQRNNNLPATGITDQATWEAIVKVYDDAEVRIGKPEPIRITLDPGAVYRKGDASPYIYLLQSMLIQLSQDNTAISPPNHTGIMDSSTIASLSTFQELSGLPITGTFDKITWKHLVRQFELNAIMHLQNH